MITVYCAAAGICNGAWIDRIEDWGVWNEPKIVL